MKDRTIVHQDTSLLAAGRVIRLGASEIRGVQAWFTRLGAADEVS